jgi:hypothetical protein
MTDVFVRTYLLKNKLVAGAYEEIQLHKHKLF